MIKKYQIRYKTEEDKAKMIEIFSNVATVKKVTDIYIGTQYSITYLELEY